MKALKVFLNSMALPTTLHEEWVSLHNFFFAYFASNTHQKSTFHCQRVSELTALPLEINALIKVMCCAIEPAGYLFWTALLLLE